MVEPDNERIVPVPTTPTTDKAPAAPVSKLSLLLQLLPLVLKPGNIRGDITCNTS